MPNKKENQPRVTYLIPVYNPNETLLQTIHSVKRNQFLYEIIVVNDYSISGHNIFKKIIKYQHVRVINSTLEKGISGALNMGLSEVRSEYVARLDAGDFDRANRIEIQLKKLLNENADIVISDMLIRTKRYKNYFVQKAYYTKFCGVIVPWSIVPHPTWLLKMTSISHSYKTQNIRTEDYCFLADNNLRIAISKEPAILYDGKGSLCIRNELWATYFKVKAFVVNSDCKLAAFALGFVYSLLRILRIVIWPQKFLKRS